MKTLRASKAGFPCNRHLWYSVNGYEGCETDSKTQRIFDVGTCLEPLIVTFLRQDGWKVIYNPGSQEAAIELKYPLNGGEFAGHFDCFISKENIRNVLADIKTMNDRAFNFWKREGSLKSKPQYIDQLHIYAGAAIQAGYTVEHLAIVGLNKNNSELFVDIFDYSPERFKAICERSEHIFASETVPDEGPRENWCCSYCDFANICEYRTVKQAPISKECVMTEDTEIINAMEKLSQARALSKEAKVLEDAAKKVLDERVRSQGISLIQGGGFEFSLNERTSSRFDTTGFKKAHPELVSAFMKEGTSTIYEVRRLEEIYDE